MKGDGKTTDSQISFKVSTAEYTGKTVSLDTAGWKDD